MNVAIVGFATEGSVSYNHFVAGGHSVTICDQDETVALPEGAVAQLGGEYLNNLDRFDLIVRSAGIAPHVILERNPNVEPKITTAVNEFMAASPTKNIIGVTGTKGKGTTSTLIHNMLSASGRRVFLGGNIGKSPLEFLPELRPDDWVVLELSSFQLSDLRYSPHIAVCLMVVPEHLNWHGQMQDYIQAKAQLFVRQTTEDIAIYFGHNTTSEQVANASPGQKIAFYQPPGAFMNNANQVQIDQTVICAASDIRLLGRHNWQNICAAVTVCWPIVRDQAVLRQTIRGFQGLPHRLEYVREVNGVRYFNDSFASVPDATMAALVAIEQTKVVVVGGFDRGLDLSPLAQSFADSQSHIRKVLLIGASADRTAQALQQHGFTQYEVLKATNMDGVVKRAKEWANSGDAVVLSPGFPSFDMFKNFEDRGTQYKTAVNAL